MANVYIYSGAAGAGTGADWANAYTTIQAAYTAKAAGDTYFVAHDHNEAIAAATTLTGKGTAAAPSQLLCVDRAGSVPPVSADLRTTAVYSTTGANSLILDLAVVYVYGIIFAAGTGATNVALILSRGNTAGLTYFKNCGLKKLGTTANVNAIVANNSGNSNSCEIILDNSPFTFGATGDGYSMSSQSRVSIVGGTGISGGQVPTTLITTGTNTGDIRISNVDFSANAIGTLVGALAAANIIKFIGCKKHASTTTAVTPTGGATVVDFIGVANSGINYHQERFTYQCVQTVETTIVRTGGATDGTTPISWKFATTANNKWQAPFEALPLTIWNDSTSSITITMYGVWGGGAVPTNADIWFDVDYLGDSGSPLLTKLSGTKADYLATATNQASDTSTWGGSTTKFKMTATFTPAQKGPITITLKSGAASGTIYIDPKPEISGVPVSKSYMLPQGAFVNEKAAFYKPVLRRA